MREDLHAPGNVVPGPLGGRRRDGWRCVIVTAAIGSDVLGLAIGLDVRGIAHQARPLVGLCGISSPLASRVRRPRIHASTSASIQPTAPGLS